MIKSKLGKRIASWVLCLVMVFTILPMNVINVQAEGYWVEIFRLESVASPTPKCGDSTDFAKFLKNLTLPEDAPYYVDFGSSYLSIYDEIASRPVEIRRGDEADHGSVYDRFIPGKYELKLLVILDDHCGWSRDKLDATINGTAVTPEYSPYNTQMMFVTYTFTVADHVYRSVKKYDEYNHWFQECDCGSIISKERHEYGDLLSGYDDEQHWYSNVCKICGYERKSFYAHDLYWRIDKSPEWNEDGIKNYKCNCGYIKETEVIEAHKHDYKYSLIDDTYHTRECTVCKVPDRSKHYYNNTVVDKLPTETEKGRIHKECDCGRIDSGSYDDITKWKIGLTEYSIYDVAKPKCGDSTDTNELLKNVSYLSNVHYKVVKDHPFTTLIQKDEKGRYYYISGGNEANWPSIDKKIFDAGEYTLNLVISTDNSDNKAIDYYWATKAVYVPGTVNFEKPAYSAYIPYNSYAEDLSLFWVQYDFTVDHSDAADYSTDSVKHWKKCVCGEDAFVDNHNFEWIEDVPATHLKKGLKHEECSVCHYKRPSVEISELTNNHECTGGWETTDSSHWKICDICNARVYEASHRDGNADGVCDTCNRRTDKVDDEACFHEYDYTTEKEATCTEVGRTKAACTLCPRFYYSDIPMKEHTLEWVIDKPATITETGLRHQECSICGYKMPSASIDKIPEKHKHEFQVKWISDTDKHWKECICGEKTDEDTHYFETILDKAATTTTTGLMHEECRTCGYKKAAVTIPKLSEGHVHSYLLGYNSDATAHWNACECGEKKTVEGHSFVWIIDVPATQEEFGRKHEECSVCGYRKDSVRIDVVTEDHVHEYEDGWVKNAASHWKVCSCGSKADSAEHIYNWVIDKPATASETGLKHEECEVCGYKKEAAVIEKISKDHVHNYSSVWYKDMSTHWHYCECGNKSEEAAHTFEWVIDKHATKTETGSKHEQCTVCAYAKIAVTIDKISEGHVHSYLATWGNDDTNHWHACECGDKSEEAKHSFDAGVVTKEPTKDMPGEKIFTCIECGYTKTEVIPKLSDDIIPTPTPGESGDVTPSPAPTPGESGDVTPSPAPGDGLIVETISLVGKTGTVTEDVTFDLAGASPIKNIHTVTANGKKATLTKNVTRTGYTFKGWYYKDSKTGKEKKIAAINEKILRNYKNLMITAKWQENKYTAQFKIVKPDKNAKVVKTQGMKVGNQKVLYETKAVTLYDSKYLSCDGYELVGWTKDAEAKNNPVGEYKLVTNTTKLAGDTKKNNKVVLYSVWKKK